jgi:hypothetical protein
MAKLSSFEFLKEPAILIMTKFAVIPAWMLESSAMACPERSRKGW